MSTPKLSVDRDWVLGVADGMRLLGRVVDPIYREPSAADVTNAPPPRLEVSPGIPVILDPIYEVQLEQVEVTDAHGRPTGQRAMAIASLPFCLHGHSRPVDVVFSALQRVGDLHETDRQQVVQWVSAAEATRTQLRSGRIGLVTSSK